MTLSKLIKLLKFDYVNKNITQENFPIQKVRKNPKIFHFNEGVSTEEAIKRMKSEGYEPANLYELLKYAKEDWNKEDVVVALGQVWRSPRGGGMCPCLDGWDYSRSLYLYVIRGDWHGGFRFLAFASSALREEIVRQRSNPQRGS